MASLKDVRDICRRLPGTFERSGAQFGIEVETGKKSKGICWAWLERIDPKKARIPNESVLAIRVPSLSAKEIILGSDANKFFAEDHYNNYPAILARLDRIEKDELEGFLIEAWRCAAPKAAVKAYDQSAGTGGVP